MTALIREALELALDLATENACHIHDALRGRRTERHALADACVDLIRRALSEANAMPTLLIDGETPYQSPEILAQAMIIKEKKVREIQFEDRVSRLEHLIRAGHKFDWPYTDAFDDGGYAYDEAKRRSEVNAADPVSDTNIHERKLK